MKKEKRISFDSYDIIYKIKRKVNSIRIDEIQKYTHETSLCL